MNTRSSILTAALLCLGFLASVPVASADFPSVPSPPLPPEDVPTCAVAPPNPCADYLQNVLIPYVTTCVTSQLTCAGGPPTVPAVSPPACGGTDADPVHLALCALTGQLPAPAFAVSYADTDDLYGSGGDNDGRADYAVIQVIAADPGKDPLLTDDGCGVIVSDEPSAGPDGDGDDCLGVALTVYLRVDLNQGAAPSPVPVAATAVDGPLVSLFAPLLGEAAVESISGDQQGISLATVHVQDPRSAKVDLDNDGLADLNEINCSANPTNPKSTCLDPDGDTLRDTNEDESEERGGTEIGTSTLNWDHDGDGVADNEDSDPLNPPVADTDKDDDGVLNGADNCPDHANADQANFDGDAQGDVCDADDDNDRLPDAQEAQIGSDPKDAGSPPEGLVPEPDPDAIVEAVTDTADGLVDQVGDIIDGLPDGAPPNDLDLTDRHDIDDDGNTTEPSGQIDLIEDRIAYLDRDEAGSHSPKREKNSDLEGRDGATLVVWDPAVTGTPREAYRLHVRDGGQAGVGYPEETLVVEEGPRGSPTSVTCVYSDGGQAYVVLDGGGQYDGAKTEEPCGDPLSAIGPLNEVGAMLGDVVVLGMPAGTTPRPLFVLTDSNGDGVPEFVTLNLPDPESCNPQATPPACTSYADPLVLPPGGAPDLNELCSGEGTFPTCLLPPPPTDCDPAADPESCVPPPPVDCDPEEDPAGCVPAEPPEAIPPCSPAVMAQPAYVCETSDGRIMVHVKPLNPIFLGV